MAVSRQTFQSLLTASTVLLLLISWRRRSPKINVDWQLNKSRLMKRCNLSCGDKRASHFFFFWQHFNLIIHLVPQQFEKNDDRLGFLIRIIGNVYTNREWLQCRQGDAAVSVGYGFVTSVVQIFFTGPPDTQSRKER